MRTGLRRHKTSVKRRRHVMSLLVQALDFLPLALGGCRKKKGCATYSPFKVEADFSFQSERAISTQKRLGSRGFACRYRPDSYQPLSSNCEAATNRHAAGWPDVRDFRNKTTPVNGETFYSRWQVKNSPGAPPTSVIHPFEVPPLSRK